MHLSNPSRRLRRVVLASAVLPAAFALSGAPPAAAYDTGPHSEITADAMTAEGFAGDAVGVTQINNWFPDLYENASRNPHSGHAPLWKRVLGGAITTEKWSDAVVTAADRSHFDDTTTSLSDTPGLTAEWDRLRRATWTLAREARDRDDQAQLLAVLGISLHMVQDFYTHTNWIEPQTGVGAERGAEGPGWKARGLGSNPTWFDLPAGTRNAAKLYSAGTKGHSREHGHWRTDENRSMTTGMSKDWPGRPMFVESATTSYFASRQWVQAVRSWVGDEAFWARAQRYRANRRHLDHDLNGAFQMSLYAGHWQGQGEPIGGERGPGGSLVGLRQAVTNYFAGTSALNSVRGRTQYRRKFEELIQRIADPNAAGQLGPVPSSQDMQRATRFVVLRVNSMRERGLGDPGPDDADMFARARIGGHPLTSAIIHGHDSFSFGDPHEPFTWIKAVPAVPNEGEPVESVEVEVRTGDVRLAGTDDDVYLRLGSNLRFQLDKRAYDDFERGDRDTYSVPIDDAVRAGMRVGDITQVALEKSRDRLAGGWRLGGVKLRVNGQVVYDNQRIDRWLENNRREWRAPNFVPRAPRGQKIPVWLSLHEDDYLYGGADDGDINPFDGRRTVSIGYAPGAPLQRTTIGGSRHGGRLGDGDEAQVTFALETVTPEPMRVTDPKPDLVVTAFTYGSVTVKNQGTAAAGAFRVRAADASREAAASFAALAPGASETRPLAGLVCRDAYTATVDDLGQVAEADEANNAKGSDRVVC